MSAGIIGLLTFHILIFSFETVGPNYTKPGRKGPWVVPILNYIWLVQTLWSLSSGVQRLTRLQLRKSKLAWIIVIC